MSQQNIQTQNLKVLSNRKKIQKLLKAKQIKKKIILNKLKELKIKSKNKKAEQQLNKQQNSDVKCQQQIQLPPQNKNQNQQEEPQSPVQKSNQIQQNQQNQKLQSIALQDKPSWYFSEYKFTDFQLSQPTLKGLKQNNYEQLTHIQARTLPYLLKGRDILGAAKTGSGKTLAFIIPCIQLLYKLQFNQRKGTGVIVITPTRQLAIQIFQVAKSIMAYHTKTVGLLIGGVNRKIQANKLQKGVNMLICTPGRLLDHLQNSKFVYRNLLSLVIDEADAILKIGFEEEMNQILKMLPTDRQTILFSATQTKKVDSLAKLSLKQPIYIGVDDIAVEATVQNLQQGYVIIPADKKFQLLFTFLQKQKNKKIMVFFSSCNSVKFHSDLLNYVDIPVLQIHGRQKQQKRSSTFHQFNNLQKGVLLCTDVAARGLDIPQVDWIVQYDPPDDTKQYIHRVGRTCRGYKSKGKGLLILLEQQKGYLKNLIKSKVLLNQYEFDMQKLVKIQEQYQMLIQKNYYLNGAAFDAYKSYLHSYATHGLKDIFDINKLDLNKIAKSFGFKKPPKVDLNIRLTSKTNRKSTFNKNSSNDLIYGRPKQ